MVENPSLTWELCSFLAPLRKHSDTFIETGTFVGGGVSDAIKCGFTTIHSIEIHQGIYENAIQLLNGHMARPDLSVNLHHGDASIVLPEILSGIGKPCVIFLDAHHMEGEPRSATVEGDGHSWIRSSIRNDLKAIRECPVKNHVILIDDISYCDKPEMDSIPMDEIRSSILAINSDYEMTEITNNMLLAIVP